jgi:serine/threonine protein kinase
VLTHGDKVRDYEIIAPIRSGGMAMLYLARRRGVGGFSRLVALKLVHGHLTDDPNINRLFLQEARIAASVAHPNVVHVEEVGTVDGKYFIAMEYVHGVSLDQFLNGLRKQRRRMSPKLCIWIAAQISEALHAVHEATLENGVPLNIVHRDVSPQNVLIGHTGHIKLIDFGIAKSQLMSYQASRGGSVLGKLRYMAPEQLQLQPVSRRTDVYALGVILWEMLTSRNLLRCFRIDDERDWATRERPPAPSQHAASLTSSIDQAVLRAIACSPDERYENALTFRRALLRAEPSASQVDAPAFAALIHHLIGDELSQRRADWPREVNVQLESDVVSNTEPALNLEELTARLRPSETSDPVLEEESDEPTRQASARALGLSPLARPRARFDSARAARERDFSDDETVVRRSHALPSIPPRARSPEAYIVTTGSPTSRARPAPRLLRTARELARRHGFANTAMAALLVACAAYLTASLPRTLFQLVAGKAAAGYVSRAPVQRTSSERAPPAPVEPSFPHAQPPLRLLETRIVSADPDPIKRPPARANVPPSAAKKRVVLHARPRRAKPKALLSHTSPKSGRR